MPIKKNNLKALDELENTLKDQMIWVARDGLQRSVEAVDRMRNLRQFTMELSAVMVSIVFPLLLLSKNVLSNADFFFVALTLFSLVVLYGLIHLVIPTVREIVGIPQVSFYHGDRFLGMIKEVQKIREMDDNDAAGRKLQDLKLRYTKEITEEGEIGLLRRYWRRYESLIFFSCFIVGYIFLVVGFFVNLQS